MESNIRYKLKILNRFSTRTNQTLHVRILDQWVEEVSSLDKRKTPVTKRGDSGVHTDT